MGEWLDEPNREEFQHAGLKCLILRNPELGNLCGYVSVPKGHPCYGKDCDHIPYDDLFYIEVHGGLTFSQEGDGKTWPAGYWCLGFDCAHAWDLAPYMFGPSGTYKNFQYVRRQTGSLAEQVATLGFMDWEFTWVWPFLLPVGAARRIWRKYMKGGGVDEKMTLLERLLLKKSMRIVRMSLQVVNKSIQISKLKKEELAHRVHFESL